MATSGRGAGKQVGSFAILEDSSSSSGSTLDSETDSGAESTAESDLASLYDDWGSVGYYQRPRETDYDYPTQGANSTASTLPVGEKLRSSIRHSKKGRKSLGGTLNAGFSGTEDIYSRPRLSGSLFDQCPPPKPPRCFLDLPDTQSTQPHNYGQRCPNTGPVGLDDAWADGSERPRPVDKFRRAQSTLDTSSYVGMSDQYEEMESHGTNTTRESRKDALEEEQDECVTPSSILMQPDATKKMRKVHKPLGAVPKRLGAFGRRVCSSVAEGTASAASALTSNKKLSASLANLLESVSSSTHKPPGRKGSNRRGKRVGSRHRTEENDEGETEIPTPLLPFHIMEPIARDGGHARALCIYIDGPMGVGKSTLIKALAERGGGSVVAFKEPTHYFRRVYGDALKLIYKSTGPMQGGRASVSFRMFSAQMKISTALSAVSKLISRHSISQSSVASGVQGANWCVVDTHPVSAAVIYPLTMLRQGVLNFEHFTSLVATFKCMSGDTVIFLGLPPKTLLARVKSRGREVEKAVSLRYLEELCISFYTIRVTVLLLEVVTVSDMTRFCFGALTVRDLVERSRGRFEAAGMTESRFRILISQSLTVLVRDLVLPGSSCPTLLVTWTVLFEELKKLTVIYLSAFDFEDNLDSACVAAYRSVASKAGIKTHSVYWEQLKRAAASFNHNQ